MRSIVSCYSDHAVKVSDSYCSGTSRHGYTLSKLPTPRTVSSSYSLKLSPQTHFLISLKWSSDHIRRSFTVAVGSTSHRLSTLAGAKTFESSGSEISVFWDLSEAVFDPGPEPTSGFYLVVTVDSEIGLLIGDKEEELSQLGILNRKPGTKAPESRLVFRSEQFFGDGSVYATKARFSETGRTHEISVKWNGGEEGGEKEEGLAVVIDEKRIFRVKRLRWNFRGNQTVFMDGEVVDVMWDVHDWFFRPKSGFGVFMFRTRSGFDSRLWFEEKKLQENAGFSLLIRACKSPD